MVGNVENAVRFYLLATKLKYKIRSGWDAMHWNVKSERIESISDHIYGVSILAISLKSEYKVEVNMEKVLKMIAIHEIGEAVIGDITPFDNITEEQKRELEHQAVRKILGDLLDADELYALFIEFDEHQSKEAKYAYLCDKLEADIQAKVYQDMGYQRDLSDQKNNVVFNSQRVQQMVQSGAKNVFDIWYEWDKDKYNDESPFAETLDYVKDHDTNIKL